MTSSLVGSEMCIRDRFITQPPVLEENVKDFWWTLAPVIILSAMVGSRFPCLLYTSDAADDM
eukprot:40478-Prorocentrum_lima.AAC.1